jgi:hypothetical protein
LDGGGTVTAFAATAGQRWIMTHGELAYCNFAASATVALYELDTAGSSVLWQTVLVGTAGVAHFNLGIVGMQASATASRLVFYSAGVAGTFTGIFAGYYTGS